MIEAGAAAPANGAAHVCAQSPFRPGNAWRLWFDNKIAGAYLKQRSVPSSMPPRPILETFKYGAVEHFGRLQVSETNVERDRAIRPKWSTAFAKRLPLLSKKAAFFICRR